MWIPRHLHIPWLAYISLFTLFMVSITIIILFVLRRVQHTVQTYQLELGDIELSNFEPKVETINPFDFDFEVSDTDFCSSTSSASNLRDGVRRRSLSENQGNGENIVPTRRALSRKFSSYMKTKWQNLQGNMSKGLDRLADGTVQRIVTLIGEDAFNVDDKDEGFNTIA